MAGNGTEITTERLLLRPFGPRDLDAVMAIAGDWHVARMTADLNHPMSAAAAQLWLQPAPCDYRFAIELDCEVIGSIGYFVDAAATDQTGGREPARGSLNSSPPGRQGEWSLNPDSMAAIAASSFTPPLTPHRAPRVVTRRQGEGDRNGAMNQCQQPAGDDSGSAELGFFLARALWGKGFAREAAAAVIGHGFARHPIAKFTSSHFIDNAPSARVLLGLGFRASHRSTAWCNARGCDLERICYELDRTAAAQLGGSGNEHNLANAIDHPGTPSRAPVGQATRGAQ